MLNEANNLTPDRRFLILLSILALLTIASGTLYGRLTQRWGPPADLMAAADHVRNFPKRLGDWQMIEEDTMSDQVQQTLECAGYVNRTYIHQGTGQKIGMAIIVGPPGPTAVHTPEICYSSKSHKIKESPQKNLTSNEKDSFWSILFQSRYAGAQQLRVYYAWNDGTHWEATDNPRIKFGGNRLLYKVQISGNVGLAFGKLLEDPVWDFSQAFCKSSWSPISSDSGSN